MSHVTINSDKIFLFKQWEKQIFQLELNQGSIIMMPKPPGGVQLRAHTEFLKTMKIDCVVSMLQQHEIEQFSLVQQDNLYQESGIEFINFPVQDHNVPQFFLPFNQLIERLSQLLKQRRKIAIHCYAGIGRTGITAASLLIKNGSQVDLALIDLTKTRGLKVPETLEQISWLHHHSEQLQGHYL